MTEFAASSHQGLVRAHNEDCYEADSAVGLWLVADGVGGHAHGEVAARVVRDTIKAESLQGRPLLQAVQRAHRAVLDEIATHDPHSNMGSTVVALQLSSEDAYEISWVGDSRAYLFDGDLQQLTRDHNPVSDLLARGVLTPEQAAVHPERNVLSQSLGVSESIVVEPGLIAGRLRPGQQILLCSDGLTDELNDNAISIELGRHSTPRAQIDALVSAALKAGGRDNITAIIVGAASTLSRRESHSNSDLETTLNVGKPVPSDGSGRVNHGARIWGVLSVLVLIAVWWLW